VCIIWDFDLRRNLMLRLLGRVDDVWLAFNQRPLETFLGAVNVKTLALLSCGIKQKSPDVS
jgi:hypothetical protein